MKNSAWIIVHTTCFILTLVNGELTLGPDDVLVKVGTRVTLPCSTNLSVPVQWEFKRYGAVLNEPWALVYFGHPVSQISPQFRKENRHSVRVDYQGNDYNLTIINLQTGDAGTYRCIDDYGFGGHKHDEGLPNHEYRAEVIAIDDNLICYQSINESHINTKRAIVSKDDVIRFNCVFKYRGKFSPELIWSYHIKGSSNNYTHSVHRVRKENSYTILISDIEINSTDAVSGSHFRCSLTTQATDISPVLSRNISQIFWISDDSQYVSVNDDIYSTVTVGLTVGLSILISFVLVFLGVGLFISGSRKLQCPKRKRDTKCQQVDVNNPQKGGQNANQISDIVALPLEEATEDTSLITHVSENFSVLWSDALATREIDNSYELDNEFDDFQTLTTDSSPSQLHISKVTLYLTRFLERDVIGAIEIGYSNGVPKKYGIIGDRPESVKSFSLGADEKIITVVSQCVFSNLMIGSLKFKTNKTRSYGRYGIYYESEIQDVIHKPSLPAYLVFIKGKVMKYKNETIIKNLQFGWAHSKGERRSSISEKLSLEWSESFGRPNGQVQDFKLLEEFDDSEIVTSTYPLGSHFITKITVGSIRWKNSIDIISGIRIRYNNGTPIEHGAIDHKSEILNSFTLDTADKISKVVVQCGHLIDGLQFETEKGKSYGPYGGRGGGRVEIEGKSLPGYLAFVKGRVMKCQEDTAIQNLQFGWVCSTDKNKDTSAWLSRQASSDIRSSFRDDSSYNDSKEFLGGENFDVEWSNALATDSVGLDNFYELQEEFDDSVMWTTNCSLDKLYITNATLWLTRWMERDVIGGIKIGYSNDTTGEHGKIDDRSESFTLDMDERIKSVTVKSGLLIDCIGFRTNKSRSYGPYGGSGGGRDKIKGHSPSAYLVFLKGTVYRPTCDKRPKSDKVIKHLQFGWVYSKGNR